MNTNLTGLFRPLLERTPFRSFPHTLLFLVLPLILLPCSSCALPGSGQTRCGTLDLDGDAIYYEVSGSGPAVVLIHGGQMDCRIWDLQLEAFSETCRVIRYDLRGYAIAHPEMVDAVVAAGPGLSGFSWSADTVQRIGNIIGTARDQGVHAATELWLADPYMIPAMERNGVSARIRQITQENGHVLLNNPLLERGLDPPAAGRLSEIEVPFLILVGGRDVPDIQRITTILEEGVAGARKETVPGAGHIVNMETPERFNRIVLDFLEERGQDKNVSNLAPTGAGS